MTGALASSEVRAYMDAVRARLADLPPEEREDLLADTEASLLEAAEEEDAPLALRLGPPERFADELRAAAGLEPAGRPVRAGRLRELVAHPAVTRARAWARELAPVWWVARGYFLVGLAVLIEGGEWSVKHPALPALLPGVAGGLVLLAAIAGSIALGRREQRGAVRRRVAVAVNVLAAVGAVWVAIHVAAVQPSVQYVEVPTSAEPVPGLALDGARVENIYTYSRDGRLLQDVLLYGSDGSPLDVRPGDPDPLRRTLRTTTGDPLFNTFPIRFFEEGTKRVAKPDAAPPVTPPTVATPALDANRPASPAPKRRR